MALATKGLKESFCDGTFWDGKLSSACVGVFLAHCFSHVFSISVDREHVSFQKTPVPNHFNTQVFSFVSFVFLLSTRLVCQHGHSSSSQLTWSGSSMWCQGNLYQCFIFLTTRKPEWCAWLQAKIVKWPLWSLSYHIYWAFPPGMFRFCSMIYRLAREFWLLPKPFSIQINQRMWCYTRVLLSAYTGCFLVLQLWELGSPYKWHLMGYVIFSMY